VSRHTWLDTWRGLAVVHMVAYHTFWDLCYLFGWDIPWFNTRGAFLWEQAIAWSFIFISGLCAAGSGRLARRGVTLTMCGFIITAITAAMGEETAIYFGILSFLGAAMLVTAVVKKLLLRVPPALGFLLSGLLFYVTYHLPHSLIRFGFAEIVIPDSFYTAPILAPFGIPAFGFHSADYFPLVPWLFLFWAGAFAGRFPLKEISLWQREPILAPIGRRSLSIYLLHQPVVYGMLTLLAQ